MLHSRTMFCPQCKAEYRPGFNRCDDCDVDLVDQLPAEPSHNPDEIVWSGDSQQDCLDWCEWFRSVGIPFKVNEVRKAALWGRTDNHFDIAVPPEFVARAKAEIDESKSEFPQPPDDDDDWQSPLNIPDDPAAPLELEPRDYKPWFPEDATAEVFSEPIGSAREEDESKANMIEMSLRENLIQSRAEDSNNSRKVFVLPEDEPRAREIVREITTGSPPT